MKLQKIVLGNVILVLLLCSKVLVAKEIDNLSISLKKLFETVKLDSSQKFTEKTVSLEELRNKVKDLLMKDIKNNLLYLSLTNDKILDEFKSQLHENTFKDVDNLKKAFFKAILDEGFTFLRLKRDRNTFILIKVMFEALQVASQDGDVMALYDFMKSQKLNPYNTYDAFFLDYIISKKLSNAIHYNKISLQQKIDCIFKNYLGVIKLSFVLENIENNKKFSELDPDSMVAFFSEMKKLRANMIKVLSEDQIKQLDFRSFTQKEFEDLVAQAIKTGYQEKIVKEFKQYLSKKLTKRYLTDSDYLRAFENIIKSDWSENEIKQAIDNTDLLKTIIVKTIESIEKEALLKKVKNLIGTDDLTKKKQGLYNNLFYIQILEDDTHRVFDVFKLQLQNDTFKDVPNLKKAIAQAILDEGYNLLKKMPSLDVINEIYFILNLKSDSEIKSILEDFLAVLKKEPDLVKQGESEKARNKQILYLGLVDYIISIKLINSINYKNIPAKLRLLMANQPLWVNKLSFILQDKDTENLFSRLNALEVLSFLVEAAELYDQKIKNKTPEEVEEINMDPFSKKEVQELLSKSKDNIMNSKISFKKKLFENKRLFNLGDKTFEWLGSKEGRVNFESPQQTETDPLLLSRSSSGTNTTNQARDQTSKKQLKNKKISKSPTPKQKNPIDPLLFLQG